MSEQSGKNHSFQWLVDLEEETRRKTATRIEVSEQGIDLRLERISFGQYAAVHMAFVDTAEPYRVAPTHQTAGDSDHTLSFQIALSGRAEGQLPDSGEFVLDREQGFLTDFAEGEAEFWVQPGEPIRTFGGTLAVDQINALFEKETLELIQFERGLLQPFRVSPQLRGIVTEALATPLTGAVRKLYLEGVVLQIFALILESQIKGSETVGLGAGETAEQTKIEKVAELLERNLGDPPSLLQLSEATGWSARKLSQKFKERRGMTLVEYLVQQRMHSARELIRERPDYPLKALAADVGYQHLSNFNRAFKNTFGITPGAFARSVRVAFR